jgi:ankyrin repeat protein
MAMTVPPLPERPDLDQLRRQAKEPRVADLAERVEMFLRASVGGPMRRAVALLADDPGIAGHDLRTAVVLGDADRVREQIARDPGWVTRPDEGSGWPPLLGVCGSRWHRDPRRAEGMTEVARLLLAAGADPNTRVDDGSEQRRCGTLFAAAGCANNPAITRVLLERGAVPDDETLYLAAFWSDHECLRLLLPHVPDIAASAALAAPISNNDPDGVRLLLAAGVDPNQALPADLFGERRAREPTIGTVAAAVECGGQELVTVLVAAGADPNTPGRGGASPYRLALRRGETELAEWLVSHGARPDITDGDRLLAACLRGDRVEVDRLVAVVPGVADQVAEADRVVALIRAAERGAVAAAMRLLEVGFDPNLPGGEEGATPLHAAAGAGSDEVVRLLVERGADVHARDATWDSPPLDWAIVGSGLRLGDNPGADWVATVRALIGAGADVSAVSWNQDKPPSEEVAAVLAGYGFGPDVAAHRERA